MLPRPFSAPPAGPRRRLLRWLAVLPVLTAVTARAALARPAASLRPTPADALGPFYPLQWDGDLDTDLTRIGTAEARAEGDRLRIVGRVLDVQGMALAGATVEIWQADARGRYRHPGVDPRTRDAAFQGFSRTLTDRNGNYQFLTVIPGPYGGRPPHVHFRVVAPGGRELVTQMYFAGNNRDRGFPPPPERAALSVALRPDDSGPDVRRAQFDLVLAAA